MKVRGYVYFQVRAHFEEEFGPGDELKLDLLDDRVQNKILVALKDNRILKLDNITVEEVSATSLIIKA